MPSRPERRASRSLVRCWIGTLTTLFFRWAIFIDFDVDELYAIEFWLSVSDAPCTAPSPLGEPPGAVISMPRRSAGPDWPGIPPVPAWSCAKQLYACAARPATHPRPEAPVEPAADDCTFELDPPFTRQLPEKPAPYFEFVWSSYERFYVLNSTELQSLARSIRHATSTGKSGPRRSSVSCRTFNARANGI